MDHKRILILDGNSDNNNGDFDKYVQGVFDGLESGGHQVNRFVVRQMDVRSCTGCFGCWLKTPGECVIDDEGSVICREYIKSDLVIFASPMIMGFTSAVLKTVQDRLIPLIMPYFEIVKGECHHLGRYEKYPRLILLIQKSADTDDEDLYLTNKMFDRFAVNLKSELVLSITADRPLGEVVNAINNL